MVIVFSFKFPPNVVRNSSFLPACCWSRGLWAIWSNSSRAHVRHHVRFNLLPTWRLSDTLFEDWTKWWYSNLWQMSILFLHCLQKGSAWKSPLQVSTMFNFRMMHCSPWLMLFLFLHILTQTTINYQSKSMKHIFRLNSKELEEALKKYKKAQADNDHKEIDKLKVTFSIKL